MNVASASDRVRSVYRVKWWWRAAAVSWLLLTFSFLIEVCLGVLFRGREPKPLDILGSLALTLAGVYMSASAFKATVTLTAAAVELRTLFSVKRIPLEIIRGRREFVVRGRYAATRYFKLESDDDRQPSLDVPHYFNFDNAFRQWFNKLTDLDALDKARPKESNFGLL